MGDGANKFDFTGTVTFEVFRVQVSGGFRSNRVVLAQRFTGTAAAIFFSLIQGRRQAKQRKLL